MDKYLLKCKLKNEPIGVLTVDIDNDTFTFTRNSKYQGCLPVFIEYPAVSMTESDSIKMWVMDRAPEPHNELIDSLIRKIGATEYDAYAFFKYNKGAYITDKFYVEEIE